MQGVKTRRSYTRLPVKYIVSHTASAHFYDSSAMSSIQASKIGSSLRNVGTHSYQPYIADSLTCKQQANPTCMATYHHMHSILLQLSARLLFFITGHPVHFYTHIYIYIVQESYHIDDLSRIRWARVVLDGVQDLLPLSLNVAS